jgi:hypothetical protein
MRLCLATLIFLLSHVSWAAMPRDGLYTLVSGTQGCAESVEITKECEGFVMTPIYDGSPGATQKFCHIGKGLKKEQISRNEKLHRHVQWEDSRLHKKEIQILTEKSDSVELISDDFIIPGKDRSFLWEHDYMTVGYSCLYE